MLSSRALIAQGLLMAPWSGIDASYVFLNSGPLFHIGTFMPNLSTFVTGGTNVFVRALGRRRAVPRRSTRFRCTGGFVDRADGRRDRRGQRGRALRPLVVPRQARQPDVRRVGAAATTSAWGRHAGGYGQSEVMGMATFNLLGVGGIGHARAAVTARRRARRRRRRSRRCPRARSARSWCGARR